MHATFKTKWVEALRSGEYEQTQDVLRREQGYGSGYAYCCLGVLCSVIGASWNNGDPILDGIRLREGDDELLSDDTLESVGLHACQQSTLAEMNDGGESFSAIADHIEQNL